MSEETARLEGIAEDEEAERAAELIPPGTAGTPRRTGSQSGSGRQTTQGAGRSSRDVSWSSVASNNRIKALETVEQTGLGNKVLQSSGKDSEQDNEMLREKEVEIQNAKAYLLKISTKSNLNLYDHLANVLTRILDERPNNVVDIFETLSKTMKRERYVPSFDAIREEYEPDTEFHLAEIQKRLFQKSSDADLDMEPDDEAETPLPNVMDIMFQFEKVGVGFGREEAYRIFLAMNHLIETNPLNTARFWGKILGTQKSYFIAEVQFRDGEDDEEEEEDDKEGTKEEKADEDDDDDEEGEKDEVPKPDYKPPVVIPKEDNRVGVNKYVYFVCNNPGAPWVRLPPATPAQISISRKIKKLFSGNLEAPVISYPPFPGNEANYLRAQIARISAATHISPLGYYQFDEEDEDEEENENQTEFMENPDFEGIPLRELIDPSLSNWVHHVQYILPQGRCTWFNPLQKGEDEYDEDEEEEEEEEPEEIQPEVGPPLLNPLSEDMEGESISPWSCKLSSILVTQFAVAVLKSNHWPGAVACSDGRKFENIYVGWGHKYDASNFSPEPQPPMQKEYMMGPDLTEAEDPSVEEEAALKAAQEEAAAAAEDMEEMEDDDEDDD